MKNFKKLVSDVRELKEICKDIEQIEDTVTNSDQKISMVTEKILQLHRENKELRIVENELIQEEEQLKDKILDLE